LLIITTEEETRHNPLLGAKAVGLARGMGFTPYL